MPNYPINHNLYIFFWKKYRPAIVKLMSDAKEAPQEYKFLPHEFKDVNPKEKGGYAFTMEVFRGKAQNNIKGSVVAQDLLLTIQKSGKALEFLETATYQFVLDKQFNLTVSQEPYIEEVEEDETSEAAEDVKKVEEVTETVVETTNEEVVEAAETKEEVAEAVSEAPEAKEEVIEKDSKEPKKAAKKEKSKV